MPDDPKPENPQLRRVDKLVFRNGFLVLPAAGALVTSELVEQLEQEEFEDIARAARKPE